jgi:hypothetical protein
MSDDLIILREMIASSATVPLTETYNQCYEVTLTEPECPASTITIKGVPQDAIVINIKAFDSSFAAMFNGTKGECKRGDYVIIAEKDGSLVIVCIEMKMTKQHHKRREIIKQHYGSYCFMCYCSELGKVFWDNPRFLQSVRYRYVSIFSNPIKMKKQLDLDPHNSPETMLQISGNKIHFSILAGACNNTHSPHVQEKSAW